MELTGSHGGSMHGVLSRYSRLGWLLCLALLPGLATGCVFIAALYWQALDGTEEASLHTARVTAQVIDGVADAGLARLEALATSPSLTAGDLKAFHRQAAQASATGAGVTIVLLDGDGQQLINTLIPFGTPLPRGQVADALGSARLAGRPAVSPLFMGAVSRQAHVAVFLPLARYGRPGWGLVYGIPARTFDSYLSQLNLGAGRSVMLLDQRAHVIAHSGGERYRWQDAPPGFSVPAGGAVEGVVDARTVDGTPARLAYHASSTTGWTVVAAAGTRSLIGELIASFVMPGLAIAVVLAGGVLAAWWLHREALSALRGLQHAAEQAELGGSGARAPVGGPREIARLALQFNRMQAANEENQRALQLAASIFSATSEGILIVGPDLCIVDVNPAFLALSGYSRAELIGCNPRILHSGRHDQAFYRNMWGALNTSGSWEGEIWDRRRDGSLFAAYLTVNRVDGDGGRVSHYVSLFRDITAQRMRQDEVERLAFRDPLTQLPNRRLLQDRLAHAIAGSQRSAGLLAVCSLDLDGFKAVNDRCGHESGDEVLVAVAARLQQAVRGNDTVARLGGDEFVLLLEDLHEPSEAEEAARRALAAIREPIALTCGEQARVSASIGIAYCPTDARDAVELMRLSDAAMYEAKRRGRDQYVLHLSAS